MPKRTPHTYDVEELDRDAKALARMLKIVLEAPTWLRARDEEKLHVLHTSGYENAKIGLKSWSNAVKEALQEIEDGPKTRKAGKRRKKSPDPPKEA